MFYTSFQANMSGLQGLRVSAGVARGQGQPLGTAEERTLICGP